jgi:ZIP family zinc transporter
MAEALLWATAGTGFSFLMTTLGAAMVFVFHRGHERKIQKVFLGFAAGVMIAASVWSLLIPAFDEAEAAGRQAGFRQRRIHSWHRVFIRA